MGFVLFYSNHHIIKRVSGSQGVHYMGFLYKTVEQSLKEFLPYSSFLTTYLFSNKMEGSLRSHNIISPNAVTSVSLEDLWIKYRAHLR